MKQRSNKVNTLTLPILRKKLPFIVIFLAIGIAIGVLVGYVMVAQCYSTLNEVLDSLKRTTAGFERLSYSYRLSLILDTVELAQWNSLSTAQALSLKYVIHEVNVTYEVKPEIYISRVKEVLNDRIKVFSQTKPIGGLEENHNRILSLLSRLSDEVDEMYEIAIKENVTSSDLVKARIILDRILDITDEIREEIELVTSKL